MRMSSSNPVLKRAVGSGQAGYAPGAPYQQGYAGYAQAGQPYGQPGYPQAGYPGPQAPMGGGERPVTIDDVVVRTGLTLGMVILTAVITYFVGTMVNPGLVYPLAIVGALGGMVLGLVIGFKQSTNPVLIMIFAALEGLFVGGLSFILEMNLAAQGIGAAGSLVVPAVLGTLFVAGTMLALYKFEVIRVTNTFVKVVSAAAIGLVIALLANFVLAFFIPGGLGLREPSWLGLIICLVAVVIASLMLAIEFKMVDDAIASGMPEKFSWQLAFGLTLTLVWIYIEILRMIWILKSMFAD
ncbi:Bax inhibitor-1/YccA family protein [Lipingzhangella sp. LS1_29]|uniref:Bax inhibitor-1/YccA family protein n=1 Tax=Lipingzhangella rawalii TaxID=2055835 RepID=A0ABU2HBF4_9ACTN|nr:Bax inhibitor-1/YccA family protein [Lipingzhangella rawalii]MDS1272160.1 Bax inhibitor-1/YccA family protein [Lipingzhangella rawalii]